MMDKLRIIYAKIYINIRWAYFHVSPSYIKFYMDSAKTEAHFQHIKRGTLHCNYVLVDKETKPRGR